MHVSAKQNIFKLFFIHIGSIFLLLLTSVEQQAPVCNHWCPLSFLDGWFLRWILKFCSFGRVFIHIKHCRMFEIHPTVFVLV